jgi:hypothetical protein
MATSKLKRRIAEVDIGIAETQPTAFVTRDDHFFVGASRRPVIVTGPVIRMRPARRAPVNVLLLVVVFDPQIPAVPANSNVTETHTARPLFALPRPPASRLRKSLFVQYLDPVFASPLRSAVFSHAFNHIFY